VTRQRYSTKESLNRILLLFLGRAVPQDAPETVPGVILSEDEVLSDLAEAFAGSLPGETATLPSSVVVNTANIPAGTYAPFTHTHIVTTSVKTNDYIVLSTDELIVCDKATAITITLPAATGSGKKYIVANINTGIATLDGNSTDLINGDQTQSIDQWASLTVVDYVANKWVII
jgi:hypothetical protein